MTEMRQILLCLSLIYVSWVCAERPKYIDCESSEECGKGYCCVIGMGRFTIPRCTPVGDMGDLCRPGGSPVNISLEYPDNTKINLTDVYYLMCPCQSGLTCQVDDTRNDSPRCLDSFLENHLDDDAEYE